MYMAGAAPALVGAGRAVAAIMEEVTILAGAALRVPVPGLAVAPPVIMEEVAFLAVVALVLAVAVPATMEEVTILAVGAPALGALGLLAPAIMEEVTTLVEAGLAVPVSGLAVPGVALRVPVPSLTAAAPATMEEVTILAVAVVAIIGEVIIMAMAAIIGAVTIIAEDLIIMVVTGVEVSGSALDGAGVDGVRGGAPRTIRTIRHPLLLSSSNPRRMCSRTNRRRATGIIARIQKVTTHMSRTVQAGG